MKAGPHLFKPLIIILGLILSALLAIANKGVHYKRADMIVVRTGSVRGGGGVVLSAEAAAAELRIVVHEADNLYEQMGLEQKGLIKKKTVLSICDFSQSSCSKRMYVIDVRHMKLLYRTYVAHGRNSGDEYVGERYLHKNGITGTSLGCPRSHRI